MRYTLIASPLGDLLAQRDDAGITGLYLPTGRNVMTPHRDWVRSDAAFDDLRRQLDEYFAGTRREFDVPLNLQGTAFQRRVWAALCDIPYGTTATYGATAAAIGAPPTASRAVGTANGQNPVSIVVPCHRVIGANGSLIGYGGGLDAKRWLLDHEAGRVGLFAS
jgi:methylated-DNA-[protein]-cysteine S-methyltransferase